MATPLGIHLEVRVPPAGWKHAPNCPCNATRDATNQHAQIYLVSDAVDRQYRVVDRKPRRSA